MRTLDNRIKLQGFVSLLSGNFTVLECLMSFLFLNSFMYPLNTLQFSADCQLCLTLRDPMDFSTPGCITNSRSLLKLMESITNSWSFLKLMSLESWCHPNISSSVVPFSSCLQSFPAAGSFPMSQLFALGGQILEFQLQHQSLHDISHLFKDWWPYFKTVKLTLENIYSLSRSKKTVSALGQQSHQGLDCPQSLCFGS